MGSDGEFRGLLAAEVDDLQESAAASKRGEAW
jgi:hypothetical protein